MDLEEFIETWKGSSSSERANYVLFLTQLCDQLAVPPPNPSGPQVAQNSYVFERDVSFPQDDGSSTTGRIDLYKQGCFLLEAKQGSDAQRADEVAEGKLVSPASRPKQKKGTAIRGTKAWDDAMVRARGQADRYARALPPSEGWPPFLVVVDVGHCLELYSEFSRSGRAYIPYPDPQSFRIKLEDLRSPAIRERLRAVWLDPTSLDPARRSAKVTRELAQRLAALAKLLEAAQHDPGLVARFLMRCLFTMFAEDVELIPRGSFKDLLISLQADPAGFQPMVETLWEEMNTGTKYSTVLRKQLLRFNGGLFADSQALPLTKPMLNLLVEAAEADWADVEPAIFGTLLERALDPVERHKLGAHYTPRAYVERLVMPTIIEPLRAEWGTAYATALGHARAGELPEARQEVQEFHRKLCETRVLDPACGSANFLYVTLEHMKRLEGEVLNALQEFGEQQKILREVDPHQFLGIEINPRAAAIAELVLWIGYLQWHFRTRGKAQPAEPIIKNYKNIECRDAVLAWDSTQPLLDAAGKPVTRWDGRTTKTHPVTGEQVPDEAATVSVLQYLNPRKAEWPQADYVVGNPPFIGTSMMRDALGDGYTESIRQTYAQLPESCDFVMYWWNNAAELTRTDKIKRFGFIATNSLRQTFNRRIVTAHLEAAPPLTLAFAIPDHPWVDSTDGAAVRISMTVGTPLPVPGTLLNVESEVSREEAAEVVFGKQAGLIHPDLTIGADIGEANSLLSNENLSNRGFCLFGSGFIVTHDEAKELGLGKVSGLENHIRDYRNGRDLTSQSRNVKVIDLYGLGTEEVRQNYPDVYQHVLNRVKPERDQNNRAIRREKWWIFGEPNPKLRRMINGLQRYIATVETAKHRFFVFLDQSIAPDNMLVCIALDDAYHLGVLSSRVHVCYALAAGGTLEDRPRYNKGVCFEKFPFPDCPAPLKARIRKLGEQLDAHRKRQQELHPKLTLTDMYNVLEKLRSGAELSAKEKQTHADGLVSVLKQIHDDLDAAVFEAYGWPGTLTDEEILEKLVALNAERHAEEERGKIRWLRPEFQQQAGGTQQGFELEEQDDDLPSKGKGSTGKASATRQGSSGTRKKAAKPVAPKKTKVVKQPWPKTRSQRTKGVQTILAEGNPLTLAEMAKRFVRADAEQMEEILAALVLLGQAHQRGGKYRQ